MPSSARVIVTAALLSAIAGAEASVHAQTAASTPPPQIASARQAAGLRYETLREQDVRVMESPGSAAGDFRLVINRYWSFVRQYPTSGYADNALWQAANLSMTAFARFGEDRDKYRAIQLLQWLRDEYPHSSLTAKAAAHIGQLAAASAESQAAPETQPPIQPGTQSTIRKVHREVLPEVVRVTIELDREVPFYQERLEGPSRLYFDLKGARTIPSLVDATFRYDSDLVRHIRLGRHPNNTTRIVLDLENVGRYSVFTLYNPYRIVIDSEPAKPAFAPAPLAAPARQVLASETETADTHSVSTAPAFAPEGASPSAQQSASVDKPAGKPIAPVAPNAPDAPDAPVAPVAPAAPNAPIAPHVPVVTPGKPIAPSANWSGKFSVARQLGLGVSRIVIDAGHGGHDPGASAFSISEAALVLDIALRLEKLLLQQPGMEVVLTRRTDDYLSLEERTQIANRDSADLFLSIHANASANETARGVETYFLNFALNPQAEAVAARENAASSRTMNSLPGIIRAITLNSKLNESRDFAASIQRALVRGMRPGNKGLKDLGVKQAPFMVLIGAAMPSVLAEISFVTNREEARLLKTPAHRQRIAEALLAGILRYQQSLKKVQTTALK
jgi:N-acetylmuramoyl-L-alanine amidase